MAPDIVDALFVVARQCNPHGLYSHTIPAVALLAVVVGALAYYFTEQRATGVLSALLVLAASRPPISSRGASCSGLEAELMGLRLYDHPIGDFLLEAALVIFGWWLLRRRPWAPRWATGRAALVSLLVIQVSVEAAGSSKGGVKPSACAELGGPY